MAQAKVTFEHVSPSKVLVFADRLPTPYVLYQGMERGIDTWFLVAHKDNQDSECLDSSRSYGKMQEAAIKFARSRYL